MSPKCQDFLGRIEGAVIREGSPGLAATRVYRRCTYGGLASQQGGGVRNRSLGSMKADDDEARKDRPIPDTARLRRDTPWRGSNDSGSPRGGQG